MASIHSIIAGRIGVVATCFTHLASVYAALAYCHLNQAEVEADIIANSEAVVMKETAGG